MARYRTKIIARIGALGLFAGGLVSAPIADASGAMVPTGSIGLYIDGPFVQGSYANTSTTQTETFDSHSFDPTSGTMPCTANTAIAGGTLSTICTIHGPNSPAASAYGASTSSGEPTIGGQPSGFLTGHPGGGYEINLSQKKKYVGFWWATASPGNIVQFFSDDSMVAELSINGVNAKIGSAPADAAAFIADSRTISAVDPNQTYLSKYYFHNPLEYTSQTAPPTSYSAQQLLSPREGYVYIHAFAGDRVEFNRIVFLNSGFEIDNFTTSTEPVQIRDRLVLIENVPANPTYEGMPVSSGSGTDWIQLAGQQLARTGPSGRGYETVYWLGRDVAGNWSNPQALAAGTEVRTKSGTDSIEVRVPSNSFTHYIFWVDWCPNFAQPANCIPLHYGSTNISVADDTYRYRVTRTVQYSTSGSGSIQGSANQVVTYGSDTSSVTATPVQGGQFIRWSDDSANPPVIGATRSDTGITENKTVSAIFSTVNRTITVNAGANGSVTPNGQVTVQHGGSQALTITPASGYEIATCVIDAAGQGAPCGIASTGGTYTFASVLANRTLDVTFSAIPAPPQNQNNSSPPSQNTPVPDTNNATTGIATNAPVITWTQKRFVVTGFEFEKSLETQVVNTYLQKITTEITTRTPFTITCQGFTGYNWHKRSSAFLKRLATERATLACNNLKAAYPDATIKVASPLNLRSKSPLSRKVLVVLTRASN